MYPIERRSKRWNDNLRPQNGAEPNKKQETGKLMPIIWVEEEEEEVLDCCSIDTCIEFVRI